MQVKETSSVLMPIKFFLLLGQVLLLVLVLQFPQNHIFWGIGEDYSTSSTEFQSANNSLVGISALFIVFLAFEWAMMVLGISLIFAKVIVC